MRSRAVDRTLRIPRHVFCLLLAAAFATACTANPAAPTPAAAAPVQINDDRPPEAAFVAAVSQPASIADVTTTSEAEADNPADAPVWVAAHADAVLWDGPDAEAGRLARLPAGSYFVVVGESDNERLPVHYWGSAALPATDGWVDAAAIGPIPGPGPDWTEPTFSPRRIINDLRTEVQRGDPSLPLIALTFDAGADAGAALQLLDVLRERDVHATFFVTGQFADRYPDIIRRIAREGHEIANHSYSHPDFATLSESQMRIEIRRATVSIEAASGMRLAPYWRAPFGSRTNRILQIVEEEGFRPIYWTFDSGDWLDTATTAKVRDTDLRLAVSGAVIVHHVQPRPTAEAMPTIIDTLRARGYELVTLSDLLGS